MTNIYLSPMSFTTFSQTWSSRFVFSFHVPNTADDPELICLKTGFSNLLEFPESGISPKQSKDKKKRKVAHMMLDYVTVFKCQLYITTWWKGTYIVSLYIQQRK